jgi:hypothetical protein
MQFTCIHVFRGYE